MADKTKYYYLKIKENFFDSEDMKLLESMDNGYIYSNILMKMYLLSLKNGGKLMYKDKIPYNSKMLSTILNHNIDILDKAISIFKELNLIEILDSGAIFMLDIQNYIGKSSDEADRIRKYRNEINAEKNELLQMYDKSTTNLSNIKDRDKDIIKDIDNNIYTQNFEKFWKAYPKKRDKGNAEKWFKKHKPSEKLTNIMIEKIERFKDTQDWKKQDGQFIPYPTTWLNAKMWEDEFETDSEREQRIDKEIMEGTYGA